MTESNDFEDDFVGEETVETEPVIEEPEEKTTYIQPGGEEWETVGLQPSLLREVLKSLDLAQKERRIEKQNDLEAQVNFGSNAFNQDVQKLLIRQSQKGKASAYEVEVSFGKFNPGNGSFIPGVGSTAFYTLKNVLSKGEKVKTTRSVVLIDSRLGVREITEADGVVRYQKKERSDKIDNHVWGFRVSGSTETEVDRPRDFNPSLRRTRDRVSFVKNFFSIDLTKILEEGGSKNRTIYEVEIEVLPDAVLSADTLLSEAKYVYILLSSLNGETFQGADQEGRGWVWTHAHKQMFIDDHNSNFDVRARLPPLTLIKNFWDKPTNLKLDDLLDEKVLRSTPTVKYDGERRFVYFRSKVVYLIAPSSDAFWVVGTYTNPALEYAYFDGEYVEKTKTFYAFDLLFSSKSSFVDWRGRPFHERISKLDDLVSLAGREAKSSKKSTAEKWLISIDLKPYVTSGSFYERVRVTLDQSQSEESQIETDGIILQSPGAYADGFTRKFKPPSLMTIDFLVVEKPDEDSKLIPLVFDKAGLVRFRGNKINVFLEDSVVIPRKKRGLRAADIVNAIVECTYDEKKQVFRPLRVRADRDSPNSLNTAKEVWADIIRPLAESTVRGLDLKVMRRYHNDIKRRMLIAHFKRGDSIVDIGSGQGGDLSKWIEVGLKRVVTVEPNEEFYAEFLRRFESNRSASKPEIDLLVNDEGAALGAERTKELVTLAGKVSGVVAFFSLTFFPRSEKMFTRMVDSIDELVTRDGKFIGIVMDGAAVKHALGLIRKKEGLTKADQVTLENDAFKIQQISVFDRSPFKNKINVKITDPDSMVDYSEYLFDFDYFQRALASRGIYLESEGFLNSGKKYDMLPHNAQIFSSFNRYFVFTRKQPNPTAGPLRVEKITKPVDRLPDVGKTLVVNRSFDLEAFGVGKNVNSLFSSVVASLDASMREPEKKAELNEETFTLREQLAETTTKSAFSKLDAFSKLVSVYPKDKPNKAKRLAYEGFVALLRDPKEWMGEELVGELLSSTLDLNILTLTPQLVPSAIATSILINTKKPFEELFNHDKTLLLLTLDDVYFSPLFRKEGSERTFIFSSTSPIVEAVLNEFRNIYRASKELDFQPERIETPTKPKAPPNIFPKKAKKSVKEEVAEILASPKVGRKEKAVSKVEKIKPTKGEIKNFVYTEIDKNDDVTVKMLIKKAQILFDLDPTELKQQIRKYTERYIEERSAKRVART